MNLAAEIKKRGLFESLEQEVFLNLQHTAEILTRDFDRVFKPVDLSPTQYNVLRILRGVGAAGLACGEIANRMITSDPDMTRLLDRIESRGLITRSRQSTDRRVVVTKITKKGLTLLSKLDEPIQSAHRDQLAHLSQQQLKDLLALLEIARARPTAQEST